mmetsp:Transcript_154077/g.492705  ORF Transcript_154077/g.492705 Transcript_154077/m.492705 type:complete len:235 (+) Transcript_154077:143-847(+)
MPTPIASHAVSRGLCFSKATARAPSLGMQSNAVCVLQKRMPDVIVGQTDVMAKLNRLQDPDVHRELSCGSRQVGQHRHGVDERPDREQHTVVVSAEPSASLVLGLHERGIRDTHLLNSLPQLTHNSVLLVRSHLALLHGIPARVHHDLVAPRNVPIRAPKRILELERLEYSEHGPLQVILELRNFGMQLLQILSKSGFSKAAEAEQDRSRDQSAVLHDHQVFLHEQRSQLQRKV